MKKKNTNGLVLERTKFGKKKKKVVTTIKGGGNKKSHKSKQRRLRKKVRNANERAHSQRKNGVTELYREAGVTNSNV